MFWKVNDVHGVAVVLVRVHEQLVLRKSWAVIDDC